MQRDQKPLKWFPRRLAPALLFLCAALLPLAVNGQRSSEISKAQVLAVLDEIDRGLLQRDAAAVTANFATNAVITAAIVEGTANNRTKYDVVGYGRALEACFKSFESYTVKRKDATIEIAADGKSARSQSTLMETFRFDGKKRKAASKETALFELVDGKVLITRLHSEASIE